MNDTQMWSLFCLYVALLVGSLVWQFIIWWKSKDRFPKD